MIWEVISTLTILWFYDCTKLDPSVIIMQYTEIHFGKATCSVFGYLQWFYTDVNKNFFFSCWCLDQEAVLWQLKYDRKLSKTASW